MTTPRPRIVAVGKLLPPRSATASSPRPGSTTRPCHGRQGLSVIALSSAADVGRLDASPGNVLLDRLAQQQAPGPRRRRPRQRAGRGERGQSRGWPRAPTGPTARPAIALRLTGRADERHHAHRPEGPDKGLSLQPVDVAGPRWVSAGLCGQAARAGAGSRLGSGSGIGGTGVGAPGRLAGGWVVWPGWLVGPLSQ
jgi:hypothetical protein